MTYLLRHRMTRSAQSNRAIRVLQVTAALAFVVIGSSTARPAVGAPATDRIKVTELKPLLILAVERGESHGTLSGTGVAYAQRRFAANTPIEIDVLRLRALPQSGCARMEVTTHQRAVLVDGQRQDQQLVYQLSLCADGRLLGEK
jgi:hypothetical protein